MERYRVVRREGVVRLIEEAILASGGRIVRPIDPSTAPFVVKAETPDRRPVELVCYAFTANKYRQKNRPADEHRFQIKYGSDFARYHRLFVDPKRVRVTLMLGVHLERRLFVGVDPRVHNPTWFSASVEMKEHDLDAADAKGWHAWERERSSVRRKQPKPEENLSTEVVVGFRPELFFKYVEFERVASGLDAGERLAVSDRIEHDLGQGRLVDPRHALERHLGLSAAEILDLIGARFRLHAAVRGSAAELHLGRYLERVPGVSSVRHLDKDNQPDFEVVYRNSAVRVECKNVLARPTATGPRVDFQKTRASKTNPCSRYYSPSQFDVLAACLHPVTSRWDFRFARTSTLPPHPRCSGRLSDRVVVAGPGWADSLGALLDVGR